MFKLKSNFWKDQLWFHPALILILGGGFSVLFWRISGGSEAGIVTICAMAVLVMPWFLLLWVDNLSNRVIFEDKRVIFKGLWWKKTIPYENINGLMADPLNWPAISFINPKTARADAMRLFVWCHSVTKIIEELQRRRGKFENYEEKVILNLAKRNAHGKIWFLLIMLVTMSFLIVGMGYSPLRLK